MIDYKALLDNANAIIGQQADEASQLQARIDELEAERDRLREERDHYREKALR